MDEMKKALAEARANDEAIMKKSIRPNGTKAAKVISVIHTIALRGRDTIDDPVRIVNQYWSFEGELLAEKEIL